MSRSDNSSKALNNSFFSIVFCALVLIRQSGGSGSKQEDKAYSSIYVKGYQMSNTSHVSQQELPIRQSC